MSIKALNHLSICFAWACINKPNAVLFDVVGSLKVVNIANITILFIQTLSIWTYGHCFCICDHTVLRRTINWHAQFHFNTKHRCNINDSSCIVTILFAHEFDCCLTDIYNAQLHLTKNKSHQFSVELKEHNHLPSLL